MRRFIHVLMVGVLAAPVVYLIVWPIVFPVVAAGVPGAGRKHATLPDN